MTVFNCADFLIPGKQALASWPVIACDQFTSEKEYWERVEQQVADRPSTLRLIYPEVYLSEDMDRRIRDINREMEKVLAQQVLETYDHCYVYLERTLQSGAVRRGLLGVIDLEAYSFQANADTPVRATERTVPERIPPRVRIRENALMELSHVLLFCDDPEDLILGPLEACRSSMQKLYDLDLMEGGGHLEGYLVAGQYAEETRVRIEAYEQMRRSRYSGAPVLYLVGDGNHSLATAKTCYEAQKAAGAGKTVLERARYATVELGNVRDASLVFEPIHRLLSGVDARQVLEDMKEICSEDGHSVRWITEKGEGEVCLNPSLGKLAVGVLQNWLDEEIRKTGGTIDYIHGESSLHQLAKRPGCLGLELPPIGKDAFFDAIERDGVLPRKTFSIGHAREKRYYLEARLIR